MKPTLSPAGARAGSVPLDALLAAARFGGSIGPAGGGFAAGSLLATPDGPRVVETLRAGDRLCDARGGVFRLRAVQACDPLGAAGLGEVARRAVLLPAGCLGAGVPARDLVVGASQPVFRHGFALAAAALVCGGAACWAGAPRLHGLAGVTAGVALAEGTGCALWPAVRPERDARAGAALAALRQEQRAAGAAGDLRGAVGLDAAGVLRGWAFDPARPEAPVLLELSRDGAALGYALADEMRPDLAMRGLAGGICGFALKLPDAALRGGAGLLHMHAVGTGAALPGMPLLLDAAIAEPAILQSAIPAPGGVAGSLARLLAGFGPSA